MPYIDIADKDTLDRAYLGISDIQNKLGTTSDSGGGLLLLPVQAWQS